MRLFIGFLVVLVIVAGVAMLTRPGEAAFDAMSQANSDDTRGDMGRARGGRTLAACVAELVRQA